MHVPPHMGKFFWPTVLAARFDDLPLNRSDESSEEWGDLFPGSRKTVEVR